MIALALPYPLNWDTAELLRGENRYTGDTYRGGSAHTDIQPPLKSTYL